LNNTRIGALELLRANVGEWVQAAPEQVAHLLRRHRIADIHTVNPGQAAADPDAG
jgi:hypothetical protein